VTGPEHYKAGEQLLASAQKWENADFGWMATMSVEERIARRTADIAEAQAHFTAAQAAATVEAAGLDQPSGSGVPSPWAIAMGAGR
jgi:hypothetical protein